MSMLISAVVCIGLPMCIVQLLFRIIDRKGKRVLAVCEKFPVLKTKRYLIQVGGMVALILVLGLLSMLIGIPVKVFYVISGIIVGFVNGFFTTLMYNED